MAVASPGKLVMIQPEWPAPPGVRAVATTRAGGFSVAGFESLNLAVHVGDDPRSVCRNRELLRAALELPGEPAWLNQVHGTDVICADGVASMATAPDADGAFTEAPGTVCAVLTADCLPVLLCDRAGTRVAAVHAGWRGLCAGVLDAAVAGFLARGYAPDELLVWLGPAIGPLNYEVDVKVRAAFARRVPDCADSFTPTREGHWLFDLYASARAVFAYHGVEAVTGGDYCTYGNPNLYSFRAEPDCGRQATLIWLS